MKTTPLVATEEYAEHKHEEEDIHEYYISLKF